MIRRHLMALRVALMLGDGVIAFAAFLLTSLVRFGDGESGQVWRGLGIDIVVGATVFAVVWVVALWAHGLYRLRVRWQLGTEVWDILRTTLLVLILTLATLFVVNQPNVSRLFLVLLFVVQPVITIVVRSILRFGFGMLRRRGYNTHYMLVVGTGTLAQDFADQIERNSRLGIRIIGHLAVPDEPPGRVTRPILGDLESIETVLHDTVVDEVAICLAPSAGQWLDRIVGLASNEGKTVRVASEPSREALLAAPLEEFGGFVVRSLVHDGQRDVAMVGKRFMDVVGAGAALVIISPLLLVTAVVLRVREGSPVLFRQTRVGLHGRPFTIYKFRSMTRDAEERLGELTHLNERTGPAFKMDGDPRITPIGIRLRRTSIDELPQLWNVLKGDMSLVGPRPPLVDEVARYDIWHRRRLSMKPGITGLWQVLARFEPEFDRWVERDLEYIDQWSFALDLKILLRTIPAVFTRTGT